MSVQIFIPNHRGADPAILQSLGLGELVDAGRTTMALRIGAGPDGNPGTLFLLGDALPGYHPETQVWQPAKRKRATESTETRECSHLAPRDDIQSSVPSEPSVAFYLGRDASGVDPLSLARARQCPGQRVTLADGREWLVPAALRLPKKYTLDEAGEPKLVVQSRYQRFYERAEAIFDYFLHFEPGREEVQKIPGGFSFAVEALSLNYRINADVIDFLELFTDENLVQLVGATFEWETLGQLMREKKTA